MSVLETDELNDEIDALRAQLAQATGCTKCNHGTLWALNDSEKFCGDCVAEMLRTQLAQVTAERDEAHNEALLAKAGAEGAGSLLLDVQADCIAATKAIAQATAERETLFASTQALAVQLLKAGSSLAAAEARERALREALSEFQRIRWDLVVGSSSEKALAAVRAALADQPADAALHEFGLRVATRARRDPWNESLPEVVDAVLRGEK